MWFCHLNPLFSHQWHASVNCVIVIEMMISHYRIQAGIGMVPGEERLLLIIGVAEEIIRISKKLKKPVA